MLFYCKELQNILGFAKVQNCLINQ